MMVQRLQNLDRRILYALLFVVCVYALLKPMGLPISISEYTDMVYDTVTSLEAGDVMYMGYEFSSGAVPELLPSVKAAAKLAFEKGAKIICAGTYAEGAGLGFPAVKEVADKMGKSYGVDYCNLGYRPGGVVFIEKASANLYEACVGTDNAGNRFEDIPMLADVPSLAAVDLIFIYASGGYEKEYIKVVGDRFGVPILSADVAVDVPNTIPFVKSGQLKGLITGMRGSAEFEILAKMPGSAVAGMDAQSLSHVLIILFIALGNIGFILSRKGGER